MNFRALSAAMLVITVSVSIAAVPGTKRAPTTTPTTASTPLADINRHFDDRVADAKKASALAIADATKKRVKSLKDLQTQAMQKSNLDLAVEARDAVSKPPVIDGSAPAAVPTKSSKPIADIDRTFTNDVNDARKICTLAIADATQKRIAAMKDLQNSAMLVTAPTDRIATVSPSRYRPLSSSSSALERTDSCRGSKAKP